MDVLSIQTALNSRGFNPGSLDGVWGRRTIQAVKAFQQANGLTPDGIVGPLTLQALQRGGAAPGQPPQPARPARPARGRQPAPPASAETGPLVWYAEALRLVGTQEDTSQRSNPRILAWATKLNIDYRSDDIAWCGLFVAHCIGATLPDEQLPGLPLRARAWERFGEQSRPQRGAVLVFWRNNTASGLGHVGFYHSEDAQAFHVLGGNQSNTVNVTRVGKNRLLTARWPRSAGSLTGDVVIARGQGPLSHNEA